MRPQELKTHTKSACFFPFYASLTKTKGCYLLNSCVHYYLHENLNVHGFIFLVTVCVAVIIYLKGNASFQQHLGCLLRHMLGKKNKSSSGLLKQNDSRVCPSQETAWADPGPDNQNPVSWPRAQRSYQGASCPGRLKLHLLLLLPFSYQ